jgi:hypothetical protein
MAWMLNPRISSSLLSLPAPLALLAKMLASVMRSLNVSVELSL